MHQSFRQSSSNRRVFIACLLSFMTLIAPIASVSAAMPRAAESSASAYKKSETVKAADKPSAENATTVQPVAVLAPSFTATLTDNISLTTKVAPGSTINYTAVITNAGASPADDATNLNFSAPLDTNTTLTPGSIHASPLALNDTYNWVGNTFLDTSARALPPITTNDVAVNPPGGTDTFAVSTLTNAATTLGGTVTLAANGHFAYTPPLGRPNIGDGASVSDTFTYTITNSADAALVGTGTVTINLTGRVWYLQAGAAGDGRSNTPSGSPSAMSTAADKGTDIFYIFSDPGSLNGLFTLDNSQQLLGQGVALVVNSITLFTAGAAPTTTNSTGNGVTLGTGNTLAGFNIGNCSGTAIFGSNVGTLSINNLSINTTGGGIDLTGVGTPTVNVVLGGLTATGGTTGANLVGMNGTITLGGGTLSGASSTEFGVNGGGATISYTGTITQNNAQRVVQLQNTTGGSVTLSGTITGGNLSTGVNLNANNGNVSFTTLNLGTSGSRMTNQALTITGGTGTYNLGTIGIFTNNAQGIVATNADGTINSTTGTVDATTGRAINIDGPAGLTTLGMTLTKVASTSATNGITILDTIGSFTVVGDNGGSNNGSGGTISSATAEGVLVNVAGTISLGYMIIQNYGTDGIHVTGATGFTLNRSNVTDTANNGAADEGVELDNVSGTVTISDCSITQPTHNGVDVDNNNTNMAAFNLTNTTISNNSVTIGNNGLLLAMRGTSVLTTGNVQTCTFSGLRATGVQVQTNDTAIIASNDPANANNFTVQTSTFTNNNIAMDFTQAQSGAIKFKVLNNTSITGHNSHAINVFSSATSGAAGRLIGKLTGNQIGTQGTKDSGSRIGSGMRIVAQGNSQAFVEVDGNTIREVPNADVITLVGQNGNAVLGTGSAKFKVTNNSLPFPSGSNQALCGPANTPCPGNSIFVLADEGNPVCTTITGNTVYDPSSLNDIGTNPFYLAERSGPPVGAQLTIQGSGVATTFILANNTVTNDGPQPNAVDEGGNVTTVASCSFPAITMPEILATGDTNRADDRVRNRHEVLGSLNTGAVARARTFVPAQQMASVPASVTKQLLTPRVSNPSLRAKAAPANNTSKTNRSEARLSHHAQRSSDTSKSAQNAPLNGENITLNTIATFPGGKSITIKYSATVSNTPTAGSLSTQGTISGSNFSTVVTNDPETPASNDATVTLLDVADLQLTKTDSPDPVNAGENITYTINFKNNGPGDADTVTVTDAVPTNTTFVSAVVTTGSGWSVSAPAVGGTGNVVFSKGTVIDQETATFTIVVKVNADVASGVTITNSATAANTKFDPNSSNNTATATTTTQTSANLAVTKVDTPDPVVASSNITYTINFVNSGPSDAQTVTVTDAVPTNTTFVSAVVTTGTGWSVSAPAVGGTGNVVFSKGTVSAGETAVFTVVVNVNANAANGSIITNSATAASATTDPTPGNNTGTATTTVNAQADLAVTKTDSPDPVNAGSNLTYTINFANNGPSDASTVTVTDAVPANTTFVSAAVTSGTGWSVSTPAVGGTGNVVFSKGSVAASETATFSIVVNVNGATPNGTIISNSAVAASATTDPNPGNNTGTATTTVITSLSVTVNDTGDAADLSLDGICDTNVAAGNQCTLRAAIQETNAASTDDVITFDPLLNGSTITLDTALDAINGNLTITGPGAALLTVRRNPAGGTPDFRIFFITSGAVNISGMSIVNGSVPNGLGGGVLNNGALVMTDCNLYGNSVGSTGAGGAIASAGSSLVLNNCNIGGTGIGQPNVAGNGGGIFINSGTFTMVGGSVVGNSNAGISLISGPVTLNGVAITNNHTLLFNGGGGIFAGGVTLSIVNCLIADNSSDQPGGGIFSNAGAVTLVNSTVSGNSSQGIGGGISHQSGTLGLTNTTITNNHSDSDNSGGEQGGGINRLLGTVTLSNTIVAGNFRGTGTTADDINGTVDSSSSFNLIGTGGAGGLTDGVNNNQVGVSNPRLGPLANNGGPTFTHALLAGSTALDAGDNSLVLNPPFSGPPFTDQRGTGFSRIRDAADANTTQTVDIGAFEADPSVEDISDKSTPEDIPLSFSFNVGDAATAFDPFTATSSNTALVPNLPANLNVTGSGSTRTLNITPAANQFGTTTITVTVTKTISSTVVTMSDTFVLTVTPVNDDPTTTGIPNVSVNEDAPNTVINLLLFFNDVEDGPAGLTYTVQSNTNPALFTSTNISGGTLTLDYAPDAFGTANITVRATDSGGKFVDSMFTVTVTTVNDPPTANPQSVTTNEDTAKAITLTGSDLETPPASLIFTVTGGPTNGLLSGTAPNLTYTPNLNYNGPDSFTFKVNDGTTDSPDATVSITVSAVNDTPSFTKGPDQTVAEDAGPQSVPNWATSISPGAANESGQTLTFLVTNNTNSALFSVQPAISSTGTLTYAPAANANGAATITIVLMDNGGGQDTSPPQTFNITVTAVNDPPVAVNDTYSTPENTQLTVPAPGVVGNDTDIENNTLTAILVSGPSHAAVFALNANGSFNYTPTAGFSGTDTFTYKAHDTVDGNTATVTITVNDGGTLQFSSATYSVLESAGNATITITRSGGSAGTATVLFTTSNGTAGSGDYTAVSSTVTFNNGELSKTINVPITDDLLNEPDETVNLTLSNAGGSGQLGAQSTAVLTILNDDAVGGIIKFSSSSYNTTESSGSTTITVERSGNTSQAATVDYASADGSPSAPCATINGMASQRCDYTLAVGTLKFAAGETSKTFTVLISQDSYVEGPEDLTLNLSNLTGGAVFATPSTATLTIADDASEPSTNAIDDVDTFVRQHYHDFLNREPDAGGLAYWKNEITKCGSDARCIHNRRIDVSAAFFVESEFQQTGYFVYRMYLVSYGRRPTYVELMADRQLIDFAHLAQSKQQFADAWVQRMAFTTFYDPSLSNTDFVNLLFDTAGLPGHAAERQQQIAAMVLGKSRADVVRDLVETTEIYNREFNGAFVATQYFGYLRRDPDQGGYLFWLNVLNNGVPNNFRAMVCAFLTSAEYQLRFGSAVTRTNADCAP